MISRISCWAVLIIIAITSCKKAAQADGEPPVLVELRMNNKPLPTTVYSGDQLIVEVKASDDDALGFVVLQVDYAGGNSQLAGRIEWSERIFIKLSGKEATSMETVQIPALTTPGVYKVRIELEDEAGKTYNEEQSFTISDAKVPQLSLISPPDELTVSDSLIFRGFISDDDDLSQIMITMNIPGYPGNPTLVDTSITLPGLSDTIWDFQNHGQMSFDIPDFSVRGEYELSIFAGDRSGNVVKFQRNITLKSS